MLLMLDVAAMRPRAVIFLLPRFSLSSMLPASFGSAASRPSAQIIASQQFDLPEQPQILPVL